MRGPEKTEVSLCMMVSRYLMSREEQSTSPRTQKDIWRDDNVSRKRRQSWGGEKKGGYD